MRNLFWILAIVFLVFMIGIGPVLTIFSLNVLFGLGIVLGFKSWLSVFWISLVLMYVVRGDVILGIKQGA